eukprot:1783472-Alexandrium_andersonii.AAC.1
MGPRRRICHAAWLLRRCLRPHGRQLGPREVAASEASVPGLTHAVVRLAGLDDATADAWYGVVRPAEGAPPGPGPAPGPGPGPPGEA